MVTHIRAMFLLYLELSAEDLLADAMASSLEFICEKNSVYVLITPSVQYRARGVKGNVYKLANRILPDHFDFRQLLQRRITFVLLDVSRIAGNSSV